MRLLKKIRVQKGMRLDCCFLAAVSLSCERGWGFVQKTLDGKDRTGTGRDADETSEDDDDDDDDDDEEEDDDDDDGAMHRLVVNVWSPDVCSHIGLVAKTSLFLLNGRGPRSRKLS